MRRRRLGCRGKRQEARRARRDDVDSDGETGAARERKTERAEKVDIYTATAPPRGERLPGPLARPVRSATTTTPPPPDALAPATAAVAAGATRAARRRLRG